jgi:hypothetical protein
MTLRVLMVDSEKSWRRGQGQVRLLMSGLVEKGVAVTLASPPDGELARRTASLAITQRPFTPGVAGTMALRRALASAEFDIVHSHAARAHGAVALARIGLSAASRATS